MAPGLRAGARVPVVATALALTSLGIAEPVAAHAAVTSASQAQAAARPATASSATVSSASAKARAAARRRKLAMNVWRWAQHQHHKPYIWGGTGPHGFDCSGLVYASFRSRGVHLPRTTEEMLGSWHLIRIRKSHARRGDLAFFGSGHVELFDHGQWTYGAARPGTTIGFHKMSRWWHPTMYFEVRR
jgi:cell wall-associated NlpC family hydrolase